MSNYSDFCLARDNLESCKHIFETEFQECFAPGVMVEYERNGGLQKGVILNTGYGADRIHVMNSFTGKASWIRVSTYYIKPLNRGNLIT